MMFASVIHCKFLLRRSSHASKTEIPLKWIIELPIWLRRRWPVWERGLQPASKQLASRRMNRHERRAPKLLPKFSRRRAFHRLWQIHLSILVPILGSIGESLPKLGGPGFLGTFERQFQSGSPVSGHLFYMTGCVHLFMRDSLRATFYKSFLPRTYDM